jgi:hypothetical protein
MMTTSSRARFASYVFLDSKERKRERLLHAHVTTTDNGQRPGPLTDPGARPCSQVKPYHFDFSCSVKRRQAGKSVIDILVNEFSSRSRAYYEEAFRDGRLRIEGATKRKITYDASTPLGEGVRIRHLVHRHEPPVPNTRSEADRGG